MCVTRLLIDMCDKTHCVTLAIVCHNTRHLTCTKGDHVCAARLIHVCDNTMCVRQDSFMCVTIPIPTSVETHCYESRYLFLQLDMLVVIWGAYD